MAEIFLARGTSATGVERYCVLKRILRERASDVHFVRMFLDEARLAAQLHHAHVAQVYDIGKLGDSYFFTMEYVHGETVRTLLQRARSLRRELPVAAVLTILAGAAAGLHHAHERTGRDGKPLGIVHRDVSPSNLMVSFEGGVKVVDFGVAKAADRAQETKSGTVKGKISYLSPEQCRGRPVDRRSDLFALGIVMWELLAGERLYRRTSDFENMDAIVNEPPPAPSTRRPGLPAALDAIALRLLAKDPDARFANAADVVDELEAIAAQTGQMISPSTLGRLLREMFGQRPEPWHELDAHREDGPPDVVTVTSEPIPAQLSGVIASLDAQLSGVRDLAAARSSASASASRATSPATRAAVAYAVTSPQITPTPARPTATISATGLAGAAGIESAFAATSLPLPAPPATLPGTADSGPRLIRSSDAPPLAHSSGSLEVIRTPVRSISAPQATVTGTGSAVLPPPRPRRWPMLAVIGAAGVLGSLSVVLAMQSGERSPVARAAAPALDAVAMLVTTTEAAPPPPPPPATPPTPIAAVEPASPASSTTTPAAAPLDPAAALAAGRHADAVALCLRGVTRDTASACVLAACRAGEGARARGWLARASSAERGSLVAGCREAGVDLAPRRAATAPRDAGVDPCDLDPLACQR